MTDLAVGIDSHPTSKNGDLDDHSTSELKRSSYWNTITSGPSKSRYTMSYDRADAGRGGYMNVVSDSRIAPKPFTGKTDEGTANTGT